MTPSTGIGVTEEELQAYVDDRLPADRLAAVERHLAATPADAARIATYRRQNELLRALLTEPVPEPLPARLHAAALGRRRRIAPWALRAAAALLLIVAGAAGGWSLRGALPGETGAAAALPTLATAAHRLYVAEVRHPVEVGADEEAHLLGWLSKRLGAPVVAPDLSQQGLRLVGGRLLPAADEPAAQLMYEAADGRRITCYITLNPAADETAFRIAESGKLTAFYWRNGPLGYALVGEASREQLLAIARSIYRQLEG